MTEAASGHEREIEHRHLSRKGLMLLAASGFGASLSYVAQLLLARNMGPAPFGVYSLVLVWTFALALLAKLGLDPMLIRFTAVYSDTGERSLLRGAIRFGTLTACLAGVVLGSAFYIFASFGLRVEGVTVAAAIIGAVSVPVLAVLQINRVLLFGLRRQLAGILTEQSVRYGVMLVIVALLVVFTGVQISPEAALAAALVSILVAIGFAGISLRGRADVLAGSVRPEYRVREWITASLPLLVVTGSQFALGKADILVLGMMDAAASVGIYAVAVTLASPFELLLASVNSAMAPEFASAAAMNRRDIIQKLLTRSILINLLLGVPLAVVLVAGGDGILGLFGAAFEGGYTALVALVAAQLVGIFFGSVGYVLSMTGGERPLSIAMAVLGGLTLLLYFPFIDRFGMNGAAFATLSSAVLRGCVLSVIVWRRTGVVASPFGYRVRAKAVTSGLE